MNLFPQLDEGDVEDMQTVEEMASFVVLWDLLQAVPLSSSPDTIIWRWMTNGEYTAKSAYNAQFGKQRWRASTSSSLGYYCRAKF